MRAAAGLDGISGPTSIADVDGDGNQDLLIVGSEKNEPSATLYLGDGQGSFSKAGAGLAGVGGRSSTSIADVDGDQNKDLLITGKDADDNPTATLYLGDGQGGFVEAGAGLTGVWRSSTSIADVDGDGNQDLVITGDDQVGFPPRPTATLYLGDGQGEFTEANAGLIGVIFSSTSIADVDGDGNQDLLITGETDEGPRSATLYLGDGKGGFPEANNSLTEIQRGSASIADVDGDGNQDLLITGASDSGRTATLHLGNGQGGFSKANAGLTGVNSSSTSIADIDGDGNQDLLITGEDASFDPTATLYLGDGQGGFTEAGAGLTGVQGSSTSIADLQGDGDLDLLVTGGDALFGDSPARIYVNRQSQSPPNRAPTFARTFSYDRPLAPGVTLRRTVEAGDLDGDSLSIGVASGPSNASVEDRGNGTAEVTFTPTRDQGGDVAQFYIEASDPSGASASFSVSVEVSPFVAAFSSGLAGVGYSSTSIADVNGDENPDLLVSGRNANSNPSTTLYLGDGRSGFTEAGAGLTETIGGSTSIADVDGDGNRDLLITGSDADFEQTATLYLGDGQGGFSEAEAGLAGVIFSSTSIADINEDGNQDLLITGRDASNNLTATLYLGDGQGGFTEADAGLAGIITGSTSIADVDGDGNQDLVITGDQVGFPPRPTATLYLGDGQGEFTEANAGLTEVRNSSTSIADVDGDGNEDLLITGETDEGSRSATLYLGDGQGSFTEADAGLTGTLGGSTSIADVDGDSNQDLLITGWDASNSPTATLYLGDGQGSFSVASAGIAEVGLRSSTSIADVDGDQDKDLLVTGFSSTSRSISAILYENLFENPLSYPEEVTADTTRSFGDASGPGDYRLVALPGRVDRPVGKVFNGESGAEWQAYWDDGSGFVKYDGTDTFNLKAGNGFWVISRQDWTVSDTLQTVALSGNQTTAVPLNRDSTWTIVSNPFDRDVVWREVLSESGLDAPLWRYDASEGFVQADVMRSASTGTAYYVFNEAGISQLTIPYAASTGSKTVSKAQRSSRTLSISARPASGEGPPSTIKVGLGKKETHAAPPGRFEPASLRLTPPSSDQALMTAHRLAKDGSGGGEGQTFALRLTSRVEGPVEIEAEDLDENESESVALLRTETGKSHDLRRQETVTIGPEEKTVELKVAVGSDQYVQDRADQVMPEEMILTSYPNPTGGQATIEYTLPEAEEVTLEVYDVLGRRVATLEEGSKQAGRHEVRLEADGLPSGVYFGRLEAGGQTRTQKITVVR